MTMKPFAPDRNMTAADIRQLYWRVPRAVLAKAIVMIFLGLSVIFPKTMVMAAPLKVTIASDSTAASFPPSDLAKRWGWGQALSDFLSTNVLVNDLAASGRSSKSFYDEGKWAACLASHADYYFIQFGHNDGKNTDPVRYTDPQTTFKAYLNLYVTQARAANGIPVFLTPPTRRGFLAEHTLKLDDLQNYAQAMREFAASNDVPVLDVLPATIDFYQFIGKSKAPSYQADVVGPPLVANADTTHFSPAGAYQHCYSIIEALQLSTNASLAPLRAEIRRSGVPVQAVLTNSESVHFEGSFDLIHWQAYGRTNAYPASSVRRYLYNYGESKAFYRALTN
jgi:lysophospholipase L1-like esterase